jgi:hypothetical protein
MLMILTTILALKTTEPVITPPLPELSLRVRKVQPSCPKPKPKPTLPAPRGDGRRERNTRASKNPVGTSNN